MTKKIKIKYKYIEFFSVGYLILPIVIFLLTWTRLLIGCVAAVILIAGYVFFVRKIDDESELNVSIGFILMIVIISSLFVYFSGVGNFFVAGVDAPWRNAVFRDLINYSWPVIYENGNSLVYYLFFWLVPALIGKAFGWTAANIFLFIWVEIGVVFTIFLITKIVRAKCYSEIICVLLVFFCWGGLDVIGFVITHIFNVNKYAFEICSFNGWMDYFYNGKPFNFLYRQNIDVLTNIFNQATPIWIITSLCYINKEKISNYIFLGLLLLPFAPLPFIGLVIVLVLYYLYNSIRKKGFFVNSFKSIFSIQNVFALLSILPIVGMYFVANSTTDAKSDRGISLLPVGDMNIDIILLIILFWLLEFFVMSLLIFSDNKKNPIYHFVNIFLFVAIFIVFGESTERDFCMNATIPALFLLMIFVIKYVIWNVINKELNIKNLIIVLCLFIMSIGPICSVLRGFDTIYDKKEFPILNDTIGTFSDKDPQNEKYMKYYNFLCEEPEKTFFYSYVSRRK